MWALATFLHSLVSRLHRNCLPRAYPKNLMNAKLTAGMVLHAAPEPGKDRRYVWDTELRGFGLMVTAAGHKSYVVQYRAGHRSRRMTIDGRLPVERGA